MIGRELPGTEGAAFPFWSPDSQSIGFFAAGKLKRVRMSGNVPTVICDVGRGRGGSWNSEDTIIFNSVNDGPLLRVSAAGGVPAAVTTVRKSKGENSHRWPWFLPGGRQFLYFVRADDPAIEGVYVGSLERGEEKIRLLQTNSNAIYVHGRTGAAGYLAWVEQGNLTVQPFDPGRVRLSGRVVTVAEGVPLDNVFRISPVAGAADVLVYGVPSEAEHRLTWYTGDGKVAGTIGGPDNWETVRFSRDGSRVAVWRPFFGIRRGGISIIDVGTGVATPFAASFPGAWSPDGRRIAYAWSQSGNPNVFLKDVLTAEPAIRLTNSANSQMVLDWSSDGQLLLYVEHSNDLSSRLTSNLMVLPLTGGREPVRYAGTSSGQPLGQFSPNAGWIAYTSADDGRTQVYVESFPPGRGKWQVSNAGGDHPRWTRDGKELYYVAPDGMLMSLPVRPDSEASPFGSPVARFKISLPQPNYFAGSPYDIAKDGRILALTRSVESARSSFTVLVNWAEALAMKP
jgi:hypothetical protein